jgi:hypothetical protein
MFMTIYIHMYCTFPTQPAANGDGACCSHNQIFGWMHCRPLDILLFAEISGIGQILIQFEEKIAFQMKILNTI